MTRRSLAPEDEHRYCTCTDPMMCGIIQPWIRCRVQWGVGFRRSLAPALPFLLLAILAVLAFSQRPACVNPVTGKQALPDTNAMRLACLDEARP